MQTGVIQHGALSSRASPGVNDTGMLGRTVKKALVTALGWWVKKLYRFVLLLRLYIFVLERDLARGGEGATAAQQRVDDGLEAFMDCWDPAWPVLRTLPYNVKLGADNPDNLYMYGTVSGAFEYRLYGKRGSVTYLSFGVYSGSRPGAGLSAPAHLDSSRLVTEADGSFEIFLTPQPRGANWLPLAADASRLVVRQSFLRREREVPAEIAIERLPLRRAAAAAGSGHGAGGGTGAGCTGSGQEEKLQEGERAALLAGASGAASVPMLDASGREVRPPLSASQVVAGLAGAAVFIAGSVRQFQAWASAFAARPNSLATLAGDVYASAWADPAIHFFHGYWRLAPGEALLIQAREEGKADRSGRARAPTTVLPLD
ncbi:hypothetical protein GPECTOR_25g321 [Gonium pectorale]|uniref:Uncharacterized protein n=1 Tax=Gonium pectorale TaxID=33097 RepID=A0A150GFW1_GONPE|nr:hypothetical protein GPECTOR_25g321 [Gonium pectorale]|eukprot:KXZ48737.1 hypothetical protein GPECTOR_25g321 [Gonium pectorale]